MFRNHANALIQTIRRTMRKIGLGRASLRLREIWRENLIGWGARYRVTARLYYGLYSPSFAREQHAYLYGRMKYKENLASPQPDQNFLLRRNIHRLEKGLLMQPRRDTFALGYIEETVDAYLLNAQNLHSLSQSDDEELLWAHDVLEMYFQVVGHHPLIENSKAKFVRGAASPVCTSERRELIPYVRNLGQEPAVDYEDLLALSRHRRSVRWYLQKNVSRGLIDKAITVAGLSPSACNRQPFVFHVFDDPALVKRISQLPMGTSGYSHNIPVTVVVIGRLRAYFDERDRHLIYIDGALATMSFMFALETLGLSSCPINWPDIEGLEHQMDEILDLEPDERPIMLISVGYPDPKGKVAYSSKKSLDFLRRYNFE